MIARSSLLSARASSRGRARPSRPSGSSSAFFCERESERAAARAALKKFCIASRDAGRAGADAEEDEAEAEDEREEDEHPLRVPAQAAKKSWSSQRSCCFGFFGLPGAAGATQHSPPGGACGAAYLLPCVFSLAVAGGAVDDRLQDSSRRAAEDDCCGRVLDRIVRASGERQRGQVGSLAGRQGADLGVEPERAGTVDRSEPQRIVGGQRVGPLLAGAAMRRRCGAPRRGRTTASTPGESVPSPTRRPAARSAASGAMPQPSSAFERGQWATATSLRGEQLELLVVEVDAVRAEKLGAEHVRERADGAPASRIEVARDRRRAARCRSASIRPRPRSRRSASPTGMPSERRPR